MDRYRKTTLIEGIGDEGQKRLLDSKVAVIGLGGLGSAAAFYLAAAGVGELMIVDNDTVALKDLQRQILYDEKTLGIKKPEIAKEKLAVLNSEIKITAFNSNFREIENDLVKKGLDVIIDCVDNNETKFELNDFAVRNKTLLIHSGVVGLNGQITTILPGKTGCLRCLFSDNIPEDMSSDTYGILGPVAGNIGALQAVEALKYLTGIGDCLFDKILIIDHEFNNHKLIKYEKKSDCICNLD
jgi:molybdopterin/thiamine biosynthesis adenylyltransferase